MIKHRPTHYSPEHMPFRVVQPRRTDYGSEFPVIRRRRRKIAAGMFLSGTMAIACFFALIAITFELLPAAIEAEIARQVAVVERSLGVRQ